MAPILALVSVTLAALTQMSTALPHENGVQVINRIGKITTPPENWKQSHYRRALSAKRVERRGNKSDMTPHTICSKSGASLGATDIDMAQYSLADACDLRVTSGKGDEFIGKNGYRYAVQNGVVAYVCNFSRNSQHCLMNEVLDDLDAVQTNCFNAEGKSIAVVHTRSCDVNNMLRILHPPRLEEGLWLRSFQG